jgi:3-oxoacyl-(acyl-carrier-protein) synthase/malonyl CoA-acyl carrier protein transacylase
LNREDRIDLEIAVVGMAGRFPGAPSVDAFWQNLRAGVESIRDLSDEDLRAAGVSGDALGDVRLVRRAADLSDIDCFDAGLFGFTPREAELMDPQFRAFLEDAWAALEDAGYLSDDHELRIGVFAGAGPNSYLLNNILSNPKAAWSVGGFQIAIGNQRDYLATQVSYRLDLRGPSLVVQTACSTSLVAIHLACQSLLGHECDVALAGGVSISVPQTDGYLYEEGGIESPDGRCRAFDEGASGCVKGNGSALVVLRRLEDALRAGDTIRAIIKGSAVNNDGKVKVGFTAPSDQGQAGVIAEALALAGADPSTIAYVEAHGTGTPLGDPVEIAALARAFGTAAPRSRRCAIGSVKTNVGHLDAAAGAAGFIKTVLALEHREIPPSLHYQRPNPKIDLDATPFYVNSELRSWTPDGTPLRAGVSSFGIGGTNAHVVLEEAPAVGVSAPARPTQLIVLSAASATALAGASAALAARLAADASPDLADTAYTLQVGRKRLPWRRAVVAQGVQEAIAALRGQPREPVRRLDRRGAQVAFLFPGQGAQHAGMAAGLHREEKEFRRAFDPCAEILSPLLGLDLRDVVLAAGDKREDAQRRLRETSLAQPALFAVEFALARLWISWGVVPSAMAGHSIGELVAACLAGVLPLEDALRLVAERGRLMGSLPRGAMMAVQLGEADLLERLRVFPALSLAAVNGPSTCVVSGPEDAMARLEARLQGEEVACRRLHTSHAFHSAMMDPILGEFEKACRRVRLQAPRFPSFPTQPAAGSRRSRRPIPATGRGTCGAWCASPTTWRRSPPIPRASSWKWGPAHRSPRWPASRRGSAWRSSPRSGTLRRRGTIRPRCSRRWASCGAREWTWTGRDSTRTSAAGACRCPPMLSSASATGSSRAWASLNRRRPAARRRTPTWRNGSMFRAGSGRICACRRRRPPAGSSSTMAQSWRSVSWNGSRRAELRRSGCAPAASSSVSRRRSSASTRGASSTTRRCCARRAEPGASGEWRTSGARTRSGREARRRWSLDSMRSCICARRSEPPAPGVRSTSPRWRRALRRVGERVLAPERATLVGVCRVAPQECPGLSCRLVDVPASDPEEAARWVALELETGDAERVVAWRGGYRWVPSYERVRVEPFGAGMHPWSGGKAFLLTGGTGALEIGIAERLAAQGAKGIAFLECHAGAEAAVEPLRARGVEILCSAAAVTDGAALNSAVAQARDRFGRLDAVFHTAGPIGGGMIQIKTREAADSILAPRLDGARRLAEQLREGRRWCSSPPPSRRRASSARSITARPAPFSTLSPSRSVGPPGPSSAASTGEPPFGIAGRSPRERARRLSPSSCGKFKPPSASPSRKGSKPCSARLPWMSLRSSSRPRTSTS